MTEGRRLLSIFTALFLLGGCAASPDATVADDPNRTICKSEPDTGSRLPKRICKTAAEWDDVAERNKEERRLLNRDAVGGSVGENGGRQ